MASRLRRARAASAAHGSASRTSSALDVSVASLLARARAERSLQRPRVAVRIAQLAANGRQRRAATRVEKLGRELAQRHVRTLRRRSGRGERANGVGRDRSAARDGPRRSARGADRCASVARARRASLAIASAAGAGIDGKARAELVAVRRQMKERRPRSHPAIASAPCRPPASARRRSRARRSTTSNPKPRAMQRQRSGVSERIRRVENGRRLGAEPSKRATTGEQISDERFAARNQLVGEHVPRARLRSCRRGAPARGRATRSGRTSA